MQSCKKIKLFAGLLLLGTFFVCTNNLQAATLTFLSDTISNSIPAAPSDHTIRFTTTTVIPANGTITITPQTNVFKIPALLTFGDIDLSISGVEKTLGPLPVALLSIIGTSITTGTEGSLTFTFPASVAVGSQLVVKIGKHASVGGSGVIQIRNPFYQGSYRVAIESYNTSEVSIDRASAMIATLFPVNVVPSLPVDAEKNAAFEPTTATTTTLINTSGIFFKVTTPANFLSFSDEVQLNISAFTKEDSATVAPPPSGKAEVGTAYELNLVRLLDGSKVESFSSSVTFDMYYAESEISGLDENTLKINKWNGSTWVPVVGSALFTSENRVSAQVSSFSMYSIIGDQSSSPSGGSGGSSGGGGGGGGGGGVGAVIPQVPNEKCNNSKGDFNCDGKVSLADFSILAYWYKRSLTDEAKATVDLNNDGKVTLADFSILAYYWNR